MHMFFAFTQLESNSWGRWPHLGTTYLALNHEGGPKLPTLRYIERTRICEADVIDPVHARYQHKGTVIPILIVGDVDDCWEAYVAGGLKRIPKEHVLVNLASTWRGRLGG